MLPPTVDAQQNQHLTISDLIGVVRDRAGWAVAAGLIAGTGVLVVGLSGPTLYRAEARLAIERGRLEVPFAGNPAYEGEDLVLTSTQRDLLLSNTVLAHAVASGALRGSPVVAGTDDPIAALRRRLVVTTSRESRVILVQYSDEDPRRAERSLGAVIEAFLGEQSRRAIDRSGLAVGFLRRQVADARAELEAARSEEERFRVENKLMQDDAERSFIVQRLTALHGKLVVTREQLAALDTLLVRIRAAAATAGSDPRPLVAIDAVARNQVVYEVQKAVIELENRRDTLAQRYQSKHPKMIEIEGQLASKRTQLLEAAQQVLSGLESEQGKLTKQLSDLEAVITREEADFDRYKQATAKLATYTEATRTHASLYEQLLKRLGEESVASRLDRSEAILADPPRAAPSPVSWGFMALLPLAAFTAAGAALAAAVAAAALDRRLRHAAQLSLATRVPVLAEVELDPAEPLVTGPADDQIRRLRDALLVRTATAPCRVWAVLGDAAASSAVALRLATSLAAAGARTLVIDADLRCPRLPGLAGAAGGLEALCGGSAAPPLAEISPGLAAIGAGNPCANASELLHSPALPAWLAQERAQRDHIVISCPDPEAGGDAANVAGLADHLILVGVAGQPIQRVRGATSELGPLSARLCGAVLLKEPQG